MKTHPMYDPKIRKTVLLFLDDDFYDQYHESILWSEWGYPVCLYEGKETAINRLVWFLAHGEWSEKGKSGVYCLDHNKLNFQLANLELKATYQKAKKTRPRRKKNG